MRLMPVPKDASIEVERFASSGSPPTTATRFGSNASSAATRSPSSSADHPGTRTSARTGRPHTSRKLRHEATGGIWSLYGRGSDDRWHLYEDAKPSHSLQPLLAEIDAHPTGIFWG
ncbi:MAG: DUF3024 domain-containing protein [Nitrososphaerales archaeon]